MLEFVTVFTKFNNMRYSILAIIALSFLQFNVDGKEAPKKETAIIQSSIVCHECEMRIRDELVYVKGVKKVDFDLEEKTITVVYNPNKIALDDIETKITAIGYDANGKKADKAAFLKLPDCCQSEGKCKELGIEKKHGHHHGHGKEH